MAQCYKFLAAMVMVSFADLAWAEGTISISVRNLNGEPISNQNKLPFSVEVKLQATGRTVTARKVRDDKPDGTQRLNPDGTPRFKIEYLDSSAKSDKSDLIDLVFTPLPDDKNKPADKNKTTYRLTLKDALFKDVKDKNGKQDVAVTVTASLLGADARTDPDPVRELIGTLDSVLHLAFPIASQRPNAISVPIIQCPGPVFFMPPCQPTFIYWGGPCIYWGSPCFWP